VVTPRGDLNTPPRYYHCRAILPATLQFKCGLHDHYLIDGLSAPGFPTRLRGPSAQDSDGAITTAHFNSLSVDELWIFHQEVAAKLTQKMLVQKAHLEERLHRIGLANEATRLNRKRRRPYPPVRPKYRNPKNPAETWSGRGRLPRWLRPKLRGGRDLDDFLIERASAQKRQTN
jgi:DNA-binding protein H-NS